jgi:hypothetical protein
MVVIIVPYPLGTIFAIFLILMGILNLGRDPAYGLALIVSGTIIILISQAIRGASTSRGSSPQYSNTRSYSHGQVEGIGHGFVHFCPQCQIEYTSVKGNGLCPTCQIPLEMKPGYQSHTPPERKDFYFSNE